MFEENTQGQDAKPEAIPPVYNYNQKPKGDRFRKFIVIVVILGLIIFTGSAFFKKSKLQEDVDRLESYINALINLQLLPSGPQIDAFVAAQNKGVEEARQNQIDSLFEVPVPQE